MTELPLGEALPSLAPEQLRFDGSRELLAACAGHPDVEVRELRLIDGADGIVIDIDNRQVPVRNPHGIRPCERLLLIHCEGALRPYDVRALRADFPMLLHQNAVKEGEPVSLCLYEEPWATTVRSWTPKRFLDRIFWWLSRSARNELHAAGQPLEQLFYTDGLRVVLPVDFESAWVAAHKPMHLAFASDPHSFTVRPIPAAGAAPDALIGVAMTLKPVGHSPLRRQPTTLGGLAAFFADQGADLIEPLGHAIQAHWPEGAGLARSPNQRTMLIMSVPRVVDGVQQRVDPLAVRVEIDPGEMGLLLGVLDQDPDTGRLFRSYGSALSGNAPTPSGNWQETPISFAQVLWALTRSDARAYSGLVDSECDFGGVLGGAGALGSALQNLWVRQGWGQWTLVDPDRIAPHNLARHVAVDMDIGHSKVSVCAGLAAMIFPAEPQAVAIDAHIDATANAQVQSALRTANIVVDATASIGASRELSQSPHLARTAALFLSPSGRSSILLLEDDARHIRQLALEAQYYRAILRSTWGETHLQVTGALRPGATCRDVSLVLSLERVQLHAAILSEKLRAGLRAGAARIGVWTQHDDGGVSFEPVDVALSRQGHAMGWTVGWDDGIHQRLQELRVAHLPNETGGVLLGIVDTVLKRIQVVDVVEAPPDSTGTPTGFTCGVQGLEACEAEARRRTLDAVGYVGHWHSHPLGHSASPSSTDLLQIAALADRLDAEGLPGLMCIVGEQGSDLTWTLGREVGAVVTVIADASEPPRPKEKV